MNADGRGEVWVVGAFVAIFAAAQLMLIVGLVGGLIAVVAGWRGELPLNFGVVMLCVIVGIGLYFPLVAITASLGEDALTDDEKLRWGRRLYRLGPIALFAFRWRYLLHR